MFVRHVSIVGVSWRITLIAGVHTWVAFIKSEEEFILGPPSICSLFTRLLIGTLDNYLFLLGPFNVLGQSLRPNVWFWALIPTNGLLKNILCAFVSKIPSIILLFVNIFVSKFNWYRKTSLEKLAIMVFMVNILSLSHPWDVKEKLVNKT